MLRRMSPLPQAPPPKPTSLLRPADHVMCTIVTGLPRSGMTVVLQMLSAGGLEPLRDDKKQHPANQITSMRWSGLDQLPENPDIIEETRGQLIKVPSHQLGNLPSHHHYRVIYVTRPLEETVASQQAHAHILNPDQSETEHMIEVQEKHQDELLTCLRNAPNIELVEIDYHQIMTNPIVPFSQLKESLNHLLPVPAGMLLSIRPHLYRRRMAESSL